MTCHEAKKGRFGAIIGIEFQVANGDLYEESNEAVFTAFTQVVAWWIHKALKMKD